MNSTRSAIAVCFAACLAACASVTPRSAPEPDAGGVSVPASVTEAPTGPAVDTGRALELLARGQLGAPYRLGGASPASGFDCSGLVSFLHRGVGIDVPRTAAEQFLGAAPVAPPELRPGDLVFFRVDRGAVDHVGVYLGDGQFVHAARPGRGVVLDRLDEPFFSERFAGAGRYWR